MQTRFQHYSFGLVMLLMTCATFAFWPSNSAADHTQKHLSFGLASISDWSTQHPFMDVMKTARPWIGHLHGQWGGLSFEDLIDEGVLDENGWPMSIPEGAAKLEALILTDQPVAAVHLSGTYKVTFEGAGALDIAGRGRILRREDNAIWFAYSPGPGHVGIAITRTNPDNPIRNVTVVKNDFLEAFESGAIFNPNWLARIGAPHTIRFMDWMMTNDAVVSNVKTAPKISDFTYSWRGVPLPVMIALANKLGSHPWFTIPHLAEDKFVRQFAETVLQRLSPDLTAHVEYSNEMWNFIFEQSHWAQAQAESRWGKAGDGWMQFYGLRAAQIMSIWSEVFAGANRNRLRRIIGVHTGWPGLEEAVLYGDLATEELGAAPAAFFDAYAVTGYFGYELGEEETLSDALSTQTAQAEKTGRENGLSRVALREFVKQHRFRGIDETAAQIVSRGSLKELTEELWPYHAKAAQKAGLALIMYEGGTHAAPVGEALENETLATFLAGFSYSEPMADLYKEAMRQWSSVSDSPFNAFVDVAPASKWGSWGALRHLKDDNPRWNALVAHSQRAAE